MSHVASIPPGVNFAAAFAAKLLQQYRDQPEKLTEILVLLPTRRASRIVREAFLQQSGGTAMLLPRLQTLGDIDSDALEMEATALSILSGSGTGMEMAAIPPAMPPLQRQLILTGLILRWPDYAGKPDQALALAETLGRLLDRVHTEGLEMAALPGLVTDAGLAERWKIVLQFLSIILENWPAILAERGMIDAADRRNRLLQMLAAHWRDHPPAYPVYAAGSTGSIPAVRELLRVVAGLPEGCVVLPGLDSGMDAASWTALDDTHPQATMKTLLDHIGIAPGDVALWDAALTPPPRHALAREIMRPAATTAQWQDLSRDTARLAAGLPGLQQCVCASQEEEATLVALLFRHTQHQPGKTAALVTFDRGLARRVAMACGRWGMRIDDSAGQFLNTTPAGSYLEFCADICVQQFAPVPMLSLLKHHHAAAGLDPTEYRRLVRRLDLALRGLRPGPGLAALRAYCAEKEAKHDGTERRLVTLIDRLGEVFAALIPFCDGKTHDFRDFLSAHIAAAEAMAATPDQSGAARLWAGEDGEAAAAMFAGLMERGDLLPRVDAGQYVRMINIMMRGVQVRPAWGTHPRLSILGPLEARMLRADLVILGGMNEGSWPGTPEPDPWMSRPMRAQFRLPPAERGIGLSAHDFVQGFCAPEVFITRAVRAGGTPTLPSRWLLRMGAVLKAAGLTMTETDWLDAVRKLDAPADVTPASRPGPRPPVEKRPVRMSVTGIETWLRDPYSVYARHVLGLKRLDFVDESISAADRGDLIHHVLERFVRTYPDSLPEDALDWLRAEAGALLDTYVQDQRVRYFWDVRIDNMLNWFISQERTWRTKASPLLQEAKGRMDIPLTAPEADQASGISFTLTAKADRIDRVLDGARSVAIIDYKSGALPKQKDIAVGLSPQLALEAAMVTGGGFAEAGIPPGTPVSHIAYWGVGGGGDGGKTQIPKLDPADLAAAALAGVRNLVMTYADPATPYLSLPRPELAPRYNDYTHLARVQEWAVIDDSTDGEADTA